MSEVDIALKYAVDFDSDKFEYNELDALRVLAAEVRRLRAAVEALGDKDRTMQIAYGADRWVKVTDVLAALEGE